MSNQNTKVETPKKKKSHNTVGLISSLFAIVVGLLVGFIILLVSCPNEAVAGFVTILTGALTHGTKGIGDVLYHATPIIFTGLSVAFAFKTGLFNIGASGQVIVGAFASVAVGIMCESLGSVHWLVALLASVVAGAIWAIIPGLFKAVFNVSEVISCIMMNYIGMYLVNYLVKKTPAIFDNMRNQSNPVAPSANLPKAGLDKLLAGSSANIGFIIAVLAVVIIYIILTKTTFGYELKAVGLNRDASKYAGINETKSIILSMMIAGALSGLAGGMIYLSGTGKYIEVVDVLCDEGYTGISVALLGLSNPIGVLFAGLFIAYIETGGFYLQLFSFSTEIIDIIVAVIIYFSAFSLFVKNVIFKIKSKKQLKEEGGNKQ